MVNSKFKLNIAAVTRKVEQLCSERTINCGDELNLALEKIVQDCTSVVSIRSEHRTRKSHVNREIIVAIRQTDRLASLKVLYPANEFIVREYNRTKDFVYYLNLQLKASYETQGLESAAGNTRETWMLYKEICSISIATRQKLQLLLRMFR